MPYQHYVFSKCNVFFPKGECLDKIKDLSKQEPDNLKDIFIQSLWLKFIFNENCDSLSLEVMKQN